jgi:hypothetical protein
MLVSSTYRFAFAHIPKAGGTAIRYVLSKFCDDNRYWHQGFSPITDRVYDLAHINVQEAVDIFGDERLLDIEHLIVCVRDPIQRALSAFDEHCRQHKLTNVDVNDFIMNTLTFDNIANDWRFIHFRPQIDFLILPEYLVEVHNRGDLHIHIMEHSPLQLKTDFDRVIKWVFSKSSEFPEGTFDLPSFRVRPDSSGKPKVSDLTTEAVERICLLYKRDFEAFNFVMPSEEIALPSDHATRMEIIHRPYLRSWLLDGNVANFNLLNEGQKKGYTKILESQPQPPDLED